MSKVWGLGRIGPAPGITLFGSKPRTGLSFPKNSPGEGDMLGGSFPGGGIFGSEAERELFAEGLRSSGIVCLPAQTVIRVKESAIRLRIIAIGLSTFVFKKSRSRNLYV